MDGSSDDFLARPALARDQNDRLGLGEPSRLRHQPLHLPQDHGVIIVRREVFDGPQGETLFALDSSLFKITDGGKEHGDGVQRGLRLDIGQWLQPDFDRPLPRRSKR